ncbi:MAG TPA: pyrrolo-quinoline quinone, partial [Burkholderiaceae bacterium]|nr:pyrrolo-quinoline quinone [Burkholderiaceae bacterium]
MRRALYAVVACILCACNGDGSSGPASGAAGSGPTGPGQGSGGTPVTATAIDVLTWHNDAARTGQMLAETTLTPTTVNTAHFGLKAMWAVDGRVDAQPLVAGSVTLAGGSVHDLVLAATEHDTVYAFDAHTGGVLWQKSMLGAGETSSDDRGCGQVTPEIGITATPTIDRTLGPSGTVFVTASSKNGSGQYVQRLHALDLASGAERTGSPVVVQATYPGSGDGSSGGVVTFDPAYYNERSALLVLGGVLVTTWG